MSPSYDAGPAAAHVHAVVVPLAHAMPGFEIAIGFVAGCVAFRRFGLYREL